MPSNDTSGNVDTRVRRLLDVYQISIQIASPRSHSDPGFGSRESHFINSDFNIYTPEFDCRVISAADREFRYDVIY